MKIMRIILINYFCCIGIQYAVNMNTPLPNDISVAEKSTVTLSVDAKCKGPSVFKWFKNGVVINKEKHINVAATGTKYTLTISEFSKNDVGLYSFAVLGDKEVITSCFLQHKGI